MITAFLLASAVLLQDPAPVAVPADAGKVESLRGRIHGMRMNLLLGGDKVRQAESDAAQFYRGKVELIEKRLDSISAELTELRATYSVSLENALGGGEAEQRKLKLTDAAAQRGKIHMLETEEAGLVERRGRLGKLVDAVESRSRQREKLTAQLETQRSAVRGKGLVDHLLDDPRNRQILKDPSAPVVREQGQRGHDDDPDPQEIVESTEHLEGGDHAGDAPFERPAAHSHDTAGAEQRFPAVLRLAE